FQNIAQFKGGPAGGFGQVERGARSLVIHYFNNESPDGKQKLGEPRFPGGMNPDEWTAELITRYPEKAAKISILTLIKAWDEQKGGKNAQTMMRNYAGYSNVPKEVKDFWRSGC